MVVLCGLADKRLLAMGTPRVWPRTVRRVGGFGEGVVRDGQLVRIVSFRQGPVGAGLKPAP